MSLNLFGEVWPTRPLAELLGGVELIPESADEITLTGPLTFSSVFPLRLLIAAPLIGLVFAMVLPLKFHHLSTGWCIVIAAILPAIVLLLPLLQRGWSITFSVSGVQFSSFGSVVHCPWRMFDIDGRALVDEHYQRLILPLNAAYSAEAEKHRHEQRVGMGPRIRTFQVSFPDPARLLVRGYYGVDLAELGDVLLRIGRSQRSGRTVTSPQKDERAREHPAGGWHTFDFSRHELPAKCCGCGHEHIQWRPFLAGPWYWAAAGPIVHVHLGVPVPLPVCLRCLWRFRLQRWLLRAAVTLITIACFVVAIYSSIYGVIWLIGGLFSLGMTFAIGWLRIAGAPARIRRCSRTQGTMEIWTRYPQYFGDRTQDEA